MNEKSERVSYVLGITRMSRETLMNQDKADIMLHCLQNLELGWMGGFLSLDDWLSHVVKDPKIVAFEEGVRRDADVLLLMKFWFKESDGSEVRELNFLYYRHDNSGRVLGTLGTYHAKGMGGHYYDPLKVWNIEKDQFVSLLELHGDELFVRFLQQLETRIRKSIDDYQESVRRLAGDHHEVRGIMRRVDCSPDFEEE